MNRKAILYSSLCLIALASSQLAGCQGANSSELVPDTPHPVINLLPGQEQIEDRDALQGRCRLAHGSREFGGQVAALPAGQSRPCGGVPVRFAAWIRSMTFCLGSSSPSLVRRTTPRSTAIEC